MCVKLNKFVFCALVAFCLLAPTFVVSAEEPSSSIQASLDAFVGLPYKSFGYRDNGGQWVTITGVKPVVDNIRGYNCGGLILEAARELYGPIKLEDVIKRRLDSDTSSAWVTFGRDEILNLADLFDGRQLSLAESVDGAGILISKVDTVNFRDDKIYLASINRQEGDHRLHHHVVLVYQKTIWEAINPSVQKVDLSELAKRYPEEERMFLVELPLPTAVSRQVYRFSLVRPSPDYTANMVRALRVLGGGQNRIVFPAGKSWSFNETIDCLTSGCGYVDVGGTPGAGACDVASILSYVTHEAGLSSKATAPTHTPVPGVSQEHLVTIWKPGKDLVVTNSLDHDVTIRWRIQGNTLEMWSGERNGTTSISSGWGRLILPVAIVVILIPLAVLVWRRPKQSLETVGNGILWVMSPKKNLTNIFKEAFRGAIEWWLFTVAIIVVATPQIWQVFKVGFPTWLRGSVQISNTTFLFVLGALVANWLLRAASMTIQRRPTKRVSLLRLMFYSLLVVVVIVIAVWYFNVLSIRDKVNFLTDAWKLLKTRVGELAELCNKLAALPLTVDGAKQALRLLPEVWPKIKAILNIVKDMKYAVFGNGRPDDQGSVSESDAVAVIQKACETEAGDWRLLVPLWESETHRGDCESLRNASCPNACCSSVGAKGPYQFMDGTWPTYSEQDWDKWSLYDSTRAAVRMVKVLRLPEQSNSRTGFASRFSGMDGGLAWNTGTIGYQQGIRVWDRWHCIE